MLSFHCHTVQIFLMVVFLLQSFNTGLASGNNVDTNLDHQSTNSSSILDRLGIVLLQTSTFLLHWAGRGVTNRSEGLPLFFDFVGCSCQSDFETCFTSSNISDQGIRSVAQETVRYGSCSTSLCQCFKKSPFWILCRESHIPLPPKVDEKCQQHFNMSSTCKSSYGLFRLNHTHYLELSNVVDVRQALICRGELTILADGGVQLNSSKFLSSDECYNSTDQSCPGVGHDGKGIRFPVVIVSVCISVFTVILIFTVVISGLRRRVSNTEKSDKNVAEYFTCNTIEENMSTSENRQKPSDVPVAGGSLIHVHDSCCNEDYQKNHQDSESTKSQDVSTNEENTYSRLHKKPKDFSETYDKLGPEKTSAGDRSRSIPDVKPRSNYTCKHLSDDLSSVPNENNEELMYSNEHDVQAFPAGLYSRLGDHVKPNMKLSYDVWPLPTHDTRTATPYDVADTTYSTTGENCYSSAD